MQTRLTLSSIAAALLALAVVSPAQNSAGHCLSFDDLDDFVHVPRSVALEPAEITIELWARLDGPQDWNSRLVRKCGKWTDGYYIGADSDHDQRMQLMVENPILLQVKDTQPHTAYVGTWHHFAGVYGQAFAEFWVDGVLVRTTTHAFGAMSHLPLTDLYIGAGLPDPQPGEYFGGRIDEVRIWNYPRTPAEIAATWDRTVERNEPGLVARWSFDEGAGQVAYDASPFGHHGQLGLTPNPESSDPLWMVSDAPILPGECSATPYCVAAVNTTGKPAHIGWQGSTSIASNDLVLLANSCPPSTLGLFFFGSYPTQIPFGEGYLCVTGNQKRLLPGVQADANGAASYALDFGNPSSSAALIQPGSEWNFQLWYRDPQTVGHGFNLTDALHVQFCP